MLVFEGILSKLLRLSYTWLMSHVLGTSCKHCHALVTKALNVFCLCTLMSCNVLCCVVLRCVVTAVFEFSLGGSVVFFECVLVLWGLILLAAYFSDIRCGV